MAGNQREGSSKQGTWRTLGDWTAPIIAFISVSAMLLVLVIGLFESAR
jgi:hypothetical protein